MRATEWAEQAAEAVRQVSRATTVPDNADGYADPGDVDEALASLRVLVDRLPQALRQASRWLTVRSTADRVCHDAYPEPEESARQARVAAYQITDALERAADQLLDAGQSLARATDYSYHLATADSHTVEDVDAADLAVVAPVLGDEQVWS